MFFLLALVVFGGCKKKPKTVPVAATQPPAISAPAPTVTKPVPTPTETAAKPPAAAAPVDLKPKAKPKPRTARKPQPKPSTVEPAKPPVEDAAVAKVTPPPRITIQSGGSPEPSGGVMPGMSHSEEAHSRQTTEQLMLSTEANIKSLKRVLTSEEKSLLQQVQLFLTQSREATDNQDLVRAHNLAMKAHLLSDELLR
ncbi:MAG TPA: hypothetical protein VM056_00695 [Terriglobales bacterium]|nr:hypothetical protein [Terriglobales bacterium]